MDEEGGSGADKGAEIRLSLLWNRQPRGDRSGTRGRPPKLTLEAVVEAGMQLAREGGLSAVTMRAVAKAVGVGAMSLYTYVPGRDELVDLMVDQAYAEIALPEPGLPWREALTRYAVGSWKMFRRNLWVLDLNNWRMPLAPAVLDLQESGYRILLEAGVPELHVVETLGLVDGYTRESARVTNAEARDSASGQSLDEYWASLDAFWGKYFDPERYPSMVRLWEAGAFDVSHDVFLAGLERLLDGVERGLTPD